MYHCDVIYKCILLCIIMILCVIWINPLIRNGFVFSVDANLSYSQRVSINVNFDDTKSTIITAGDPVIIETNSESDSSGNQKYPGWLDFDAEL